MRTSTRGPYRTQYTASLDVLLQVNWLVLGSKLPWRVVPDHPIDLRTQFSAGVDLSEKFWLRVQYRRDISWSYGYPNRCLVNILPRIPSYFAMWNCYLLEFGVVRHSQTKCKPRDPKRKPGAC